MKGLQSGGVGAKIKPSPFKSRTEWNGGSEIGKEEWCTPDAEEVQRNPPVSRVLTWDGNQRLRQIIQEHFLLPPPLQVSQNREADEKNISIVGNADYK